MQLEALCFLTICFAVVVETEVEVLVPGANMDTEVNANVNMDMSVGVFGATAEMELGLGYHFETVRTATTVTSVEDSSHASFSLADDDGGDFFVVQLYRDPYYGVPLFYTGKKDVMICFPGARRSLSCV